MPDIVTSKTFIDGEKGITAAKLNQIISGAVIQPSFVSGKPASSTLDPTDQLLELKGTGSYATITGSQLISSVSAQVDATPQIYSTRLRSINILGNPTFEVAQRNCRSALVNPANGSFIEDRWVAGNTALNPTFQGVQTALGATQGIAVPGTSFIITTGSIKVTIGTQKASLAASDYLHIQQTVEGSSFRELMSDVHSLQILCRSNIANLKFGLRLGDPTASRSLTKLCTLGAANTIALISLPNLPIWPSAGTFTAAPGSIGYVLNICLASGTTFISPANDTFQNGNFLQAVGADNFLANAVGSTFEAFFVSHEPGALCTTPMDCPFTQNYDSCLRYYQKSYDYGTAPGTATTNGAWSCSAAAAAHAINPLPFQKRMAKVPTFVMRSTAAGATFNAIRDNNAAVDRTVTGTVNLGETGCGGVFIGTTNAAQTYYYGQWVADTNW